MVRSMLRSLDSSLVDLDDDRTGSCSGTMIGGEGAPEVSPSVLALCLGLDELELELEGSCERRKS